MASSTDGQNLIATTIVNQITPTCTAMTSPNSDPLITKGLDELIKFINGTEGEENKRPLSAKAAKRARQKQRKVG